jgi:hypothetical protein
VAPGITLSLWLTLSVRALSPCLLGKSLIPTNLRMTLIPWFPLRRSIDWIHVLLIGVGIRCLVKWQGWILCQLSVCCLFLVVMQKTCWTLHDNHRLHEGEKLLTCK